jgi:L-aminopeptidase/D-esterase-like protein
MSGTLTAVAGIAVGHAHDLAALTGCTVVLLPEGTTASVDIRGGAPGTRDTALLAPSRFVQHIDAICLSGGSAFGLDAAGGVMRWLRERGRGFDTGIARIPIVPGAVIFDLGVGSADRWPDVHMGYSACEVASTDPVAEGCVGAGTGAAVGKLMGVPLAMKAGLGSAATVLASGVTIAALAVANAFGDVYRDGTRQIIAGVRNPGGGFLNAAAMLRQMGDLAWSGAPNTTLVVVATDAAIDKAGCEKLAQMAQDGLARTIRPIHTPFDGDTVFGVSTGARPAPHMVALGTAAADVTALAIERAVLMATALGGLPAASDLTKGG